MSALGQDVVEAAGLQDAQAPVLQRRGVSGGDAIAGPARQRTEPALQQTQQQRCLAFLTAFLPPPLLAFLTALLPAFLLALLQPLLLPGFRACRRPLIPIKPAQVRTLHRGPDARVRPFEHAAVSVVIRQPPIVDLPYGFQRRRNHLNMLVLNDFTELSPLRLQCSY